MNHSFVFSLFFLALMMISCRERSEDEKRPDFLRFEKIDRFKCNIGEPADLPYQSKVIYYFNNGLPHRWIERDSLRTTLTDFFYNYNEDWIRTGAKYREPGDKDYSIERLVYSADSMEVTTEWLDATGQVYYRMVEEHNENGDPIVASFIGDELHGRDTVTYTEEGFENRIFFTNVYGKVFNDRSFEYISINENGDWTERKKWMGDTLNEIQKRTINYWGKENESSQIFYDGVVSTPLTENKLSFDASGNTLVFTRGEDWEIQQAYISIKEHGIFTESQPIPGLDSVYNISISPSGNRTLYSVRTDNDPEVWVMEKLIDEWKEPVNLTSANKVSGGYFHLYTENEIYFYVPLNHGDLVSGKLENGKLDIGESLDFFNTKNGTEFSPFMGRDKRYFVFTRYLEGDPDQQGFFISYNRGEENEPDWSMEQKIEELPYGWGAFVSEKEGLFYYTDGEDLYQVPISLLNISL
ncbi:MAG: hypothetical protein HKN53_01540 [Maribacter sp.]|nr:hypothetical protein [Maribacter sp.]